MDNRDLQLSGKATDDIWAMRESDGNIGLRLDCGDAGFVSLTPEQAKTVIVTLQEMMGKQP